MEDNIQTIISIILAAFILFIFPIYMAYEKKDDISYTLAMRYSQDLVNEVRNKGYLTKEMYYEYKNRLSTTGNSYDIQLTHKYRRFDPITNYYKLEDNTYVIVKTSTQDKRQLVEEQYIKNCSLTNKTSETVKQKCIDEGYKKEGIDKVENTYVLSEEEYGTEYILRILELENKLLLNSVSDNIVCDDLANDECQYAYVMNTDDVFNVTIKNTNITPATVIFNMVTLDALNKNTRIYVNYGGTILNTRWYGNIDYSKLKHDNLNLNNEFEENVILDGERIYKGNINQDSKINLNYDTKYIIEFYVKPDEITELQQRGAIYNDNLQYNFALGSDGKEKNNLSVSVGMNGISLLTNQSSSLAIKSNAIILPKYDYLKPHCVDEITNLEKDCSAYDEIKWHSSETIQSTIANYSNFEFTKVSENIIKVRATSNKESLQDLNEDITITSNANLISNFNSKIVSNSIGKTTWKIDNVEYTINLEESVISFHAREATSNTQVILSYPVKIDEYTKIRIDFKEIESNNYKGYLYVDNEKVDETIILSELPKLNMVGSSTIYSTKYYVGNLKNIKIMTLR